MVWQLWFGNFRLGAFIWKLSFESFGFGNCCLGPLAWELWFGNFGLETLVWEPFYENSELSFGNLRLGKLRLRTLVWKIPFLEISFGNFRLGTLAWELWLWIFCQVSFAWEISFEDYRLIFSVWDPSFGNFRFRTFALELSFWNFSLGTCAY